MPTEYAVQYRTYMNGPFDRLITSSGMTGRALFSRNEAQAEVESFNQTNDVARLVSREVTEWQPVAERYVPWQEKRAQAERECTDSRP